MIEMKRGTLWLRRAKTLGSGLLFVAIVCSLLFGASHVLMPKNNQKAFGMTNQEAHGVLGERSGSIDVLFLGDSEAANSFSPLQMYKEQGFTSYVSATNGQKLFYTRTLLHRALKDHNPRVVVIETNTTYTDFTLSEAIERVGQDLFPAFEYHDRWKSLTFDDIKAPVKNTWTDEFKGYYFGKDVHAADPTGHMAATDEVAKIAPLNEFYLKDIVNYVKSRGAIPVLVSTPSTMNWNYARHNAISQFAQKEQVAYLDLNLDPQRVGIDWNTDTWDKGDHLNYYGASKVSRFIGAYLKETYQLPDRKNDTAYASWNEALANYEKRVSGAS